MHSNDTPGRSEAEHAPQTPARVLQDPDIMGGAPCFAGTRVPVDIVLASLDAGVAWSRLVASYPFLTEEHVDAAREFVKANPVKRGS